MGIYVGVPAGSGYEGWHRWARSVLINFRDRLPPGSLIKIRRFREGVCKAMNWFTEDFLETNCDKILYLRDDVIPPALAGSEMLYLDRDVLTALVPRAEIPHNPEIGDWCEDGYARSLLDFPGNELFKVDWCSAECLMVDRKVFDELPRPWWMKGQNPYVDEGLRFCRMLKEAGFGVTVAPWLECYKVRGDFVYTVGHFRRMLRRDTVYRWDQDERYAPRFVAGPVFRA